MLEIISSSGAHYRLHPTRRDALQEQRKPGGRWAFFGAYGTESAARRRLAQLGNLQVDGQGTIQPEEEPR